ncbi:hypothetical cytosolic protein [Syntrophus aciditrophicus SB]|uniref:Hypothetical cytosolic protein n=1 Tax=Syntrophus aciditrophicus (strain SB) TaxID=56780 RepID=Q2LXZ3_SYNAS|nr:hypothetical cytosolic protein [Syntrophus aciditrophicus SB]
MGEEDEDSIHRAYSMLMLLCFERLIFIKYTIASGCTRATCRDLAEEPWRS